MTLCARSHCAELLRVVLFAASVLALLAPAMAQQASSAADTRALTEITRCAAQLDPIVDIGFERVSARCPQLPPALDAASWRELLPPNWRERGDSLSRDGLLALANLVAERDSAKPARAAPNPQMVADTLAEIGAITDDGASRWQRFKRWLRAVFKRAEDGERRGILRRLFGPVEVSEAVSRTLTYLGYALLIGFAFWVVGNELRLSGVLSMRRRRAAHATGTADSLGTGPTLGDIDAAPLAARPGLLVGLLAARLRRAAGSPPTTAMASPELNTLWRKVVPDSAAAFARLTHAADRVRFAPAPVSPTELEAAEATGRGLLAELTRGVQLRGSP
jgi:hypothetical protein